MFWLWKFLTVDVMLLNYGGDLCFQITKCFNVFVYADLPDLE